MSSVRITGPSAVAIARTDSTADNAYGPGVWRYSSSTPTAAPCAVIGQANTACTPSSATTSQANSGHFAVPARSVRSGTAIVVPALNESRHGPSPMVN